jgi:hypothetical protein
VIYLEQDFDLDPASPKTRDAFVELAEKTLVPAQARLGGRLVAAWFNHAEWYNQLKHIVEFDDLAAFAAFRDVARADEEWRECATRIEELAPRRSDALLEPLGPVEPARLHRAIEEAKEKPVGAHTFAILEVNAGAMDTFSGMLGAAKDQLPILAAWRGITGNPNQVIDLWSGDTGRDRFRPANDAMNAFFEPLRKMAPRERMVSLFPLPYSPLC